MRKATGKVVSLVLALALVVTSFSSIAAFAATKTETGTATIVDTNKDLYLANTNGSTNSGTTYNLSAHLAGKVELETYDHQTVTADIKITQVSVSGDNIVRVTKDSDTEDYILTVRDKKGTGKATLNILFTAEDAVSRDDVTSTLRGSATMTVTLLDSSTAILASGEKLPDAGKGVDSFSGLQKNPNNGTAVEATAMVVKPQPVSDDSALATYVKQTVVEKNDEAAGYVKGGYVVAVSGTDTAVDVASNDITYSIDTPSVGNTIRLTVYSVKEVDDGFATDKTVAQTTVKVENKVKGNVTEIDVGDGTSANINGSDKATVMSKSKTYAEVDSVIWDVTGAAIESTAASDDEVEVLAGRIGDLKTAGAAVSINDGTVGAVETSGKVEVLGGTVTSVKAGGNVTISGGTVGEVKDAAELRVEAGKVTGAVSADAVHLAPLNDEEPVSVGAVSAQVLSIDGTNAVAAAGAFKATGAATVTLTGDKASVAGIDFDYYESSLRLENFQGTVAAPTKANDTGNSAVNTGAVITTDADGETDATVSGNVALREIAIESGSVAFTGNVKVDNLYGGEADLTINAGALNIVDSVATSNTLKIADAADVVPGTVVFTATTDIADVDSFINYGFGLKLVSGTSYDAFVIDSVSFSGLTMNKTEAKILLGTSETFTASAYPAGTSLPEGAYIKFFLDGDENYVSGVDNGNGTATIEALKYDSTFDVLNKATLTAQVYDQYDIQLEEYGEATCAITVIEKPETTYVSDTTGNVNVVAGNTYQFKITSTNGAVPQFAVAGDGSIFKLVAQSNEGNDYFFKVQAVGTVGQVCGVYVNKEATPVATLTVSADYTCDTTTVNVAVGATYQVKITANSMPTLAAGNSIYSVAFASQSGNDYFFKITATQNAKAGDAVGFYINGAPSPAFVATTV